MSILLLLVLSGNNNNTVDSTLLFRICDEHRDPLVATVIEKGIFNCILQLMFCQVSQSVFNGLHPHAVTELSALGKAFVDSQLAATDGTDLAAATIA